MTVKFKVVPVTRWQVIRVEDKGNSGGAAPMGDFDNPSTAERVGKLLAAGENVAFEGVGSDSAVQAFDTLGRSALDAQTRLAAGGQQQANLGALQQRNEFVTGLSAVQGT